MVFQPTQCFPGESSVCQPWKQKDEEPQGPAHKQCRQILLVVSGRVYSTGKRALHCYAFAHFLTQDGILLELKENPKQQWLNQNRSYVPLKVWVVSLGLGWELHSPQQLQFVSSSLAMPSTLCSKGAARALVIMSTSQQGKTRTRRNVATLQTYSAEVAPTTPTYVPVIETCTRACTQLQGRLKTEPLFSQPCVQLKPWLLFLWKSRENGHQGAANRLDHTCLLCTRVPALSSVCLSHSFLKTKLTHDLLREVSLVFNPSQIALSLFPPLLINYIEIQFHTVKCTHFKHTGQYILTDAFNHRQHQDTQHFYLFIFLPLKGPPGPICSSDFLNFWLGQSPICFLSIQISLNLLEFCINKIII